MRLFHSIFIFTCLIISSCDKKTEKSVQNLEKPKMLVDKKTVYEFLNYNFSSPNLIFKNCKSVLNRDPLPYFEKQDSIALSKMDTIFSKSDIEFIFKQSKYGPHFIIEKEYFKEITIVEVNMKKAFSDTIHTRKKYWEEINNKYFETCATNIPLFSLDKQTAVIKISYNCGILCGEFGIFVYRKENGKWKLLATISHGVS